MKWLLSIPLHLLGLALVFAAAFGVCALLGWREFTTVLTGTFVTGDEFLDALRGVAYLVCYFGYVVAAPILAIAAVVLFALEKLFLREPGRGGAADPADASC